MKIRKNLRKLGEIANEIFLDLTIPYTLQKRVLETATARDRYLAERKSLSLKEYFLKYTQ